MSSQGGLENAASSYRPKGYGMSASLRRARGQFLVRNVATGIAVASFTVGIWAYSISAVKQDVFDDVDEQARALNAVPNNPPSVSPKSMDDPANVAAVLHETHVTASTVLQKTQSNGPRGVVLAALGERCPWLFEPTHKTLVWGAPPVDRIGRIQDKRPVSWNESD